MELTQFLEEGRGRWQALEMLLTEVDRRGVAKLDLSEAKDLGRLYRQASADLLWARSHGASAEVVDYLNDLVARAHGRIHPNPRPRLSAITRFLAVGYPRLVRQEWRAIALSTAFFLAGSAFGGIAMAVDPDAWIYLVPEQHQHLDPAQRVERDAGRKLDADEEAAFSAFLFTHNIQVTILVFAVGLAGGILTAVLLFFNGIGLGALGWLYWTRGHGLFFVAWIFPHGSLELSAVFIAGGAGFVLGRSILAPGRLGRRRALREAAQTAVLLVLGTAPVLVVAGLIEGTISQWHEPVIDLRVKVAFACAAFVLLWLYLLRAGRGVTPGEEGATSGAAA
ncbi:MAG: stage II sporulation protein M [Deltaproteobacteria bacterium]|nr:stage II sporulation protein M [Deltaproteobacteria bacterium]